MSFYSNILRNRPQRRVYLTPTQLIEAAAEHFAHYEAHPPQQQKLHFDKDGNASYASVDLNRMFTKTALHTALGLRANGMAELAERGPYWADAVKAIYDVIEMQQLEGAACGQLNANIVQRLNNLADKSAVELTGATDPSTGTAEPVKIEIQPMAAGTFLRPEGDFEPVEDDQKFT